MDKDEIIKIQGLFITLAARETSLQHVRELLPEPPADVIEPTQNHIKEVRRHIAAIADMPAHMKEDLEKLAMVAASLSLLTIGFRIDCASCRWSKETDADGCIKQETNHVLKRVEEILRGEAKSKDVACPYRSLMYETAWCPQFKCVENRISDVDRSGRNKKAVKASLAVLKQNIQALSDSIETP